MSNLQLQTIQMGNHYGFLHILTLWDGRLYMCLKKTWWGGLEFMQKIIWTDQIVILLSYVYWFVNGSEGKRPLNEKTRSAVCVTRNPTHPALPRHAINRPKGLGACYFQLPSTHQMDIQHNSYISSLYDLIQRYDELINVKPASPTLETVQQYVHMSYIIYVEL